MILVPLTQAVDIKHNDHTQIQTIELCMLKWMDSKLDPKMLNYEGDSINNNKWNKSVINKQQSCIGVLP